MKMKSAVLASALVAVSSVFATSLYDSDVIYKTWFTDTTGGNITEETPVFLDNNGVAATASNGYAVTAEVSVVIHAALPDVPAKVDNVSPKGSICAADVNGTAKWYGLADGSWVELTLPDGTTPFATPGATTYTLVTEFDDTDSAHRVRYSVISNNITQTSDWYISGHANALQKVGLAGTGSYTKVVGLLVNAWKETGIDTSIPIAISKATLVAMGINTGDSTIDSIKTTLTADQGNGIAAWANYALGISDNVTEKVAATKKPFAAPVQNSYSSKLTFKLGGVNARKDVADVTYAIETLASLDDTNATTSGYVDAGTDQTITLDVPDTVKYYRVKVKIDQAN